MTTDTLGDRLKAYEDKERFGPIVYARLDGRRFSKFTRGFARPFDQRLCDVMDDVTQHLVEESGADIGYTQSDEISLGWRTPERLFFEGKKQKMISVLASIATARFAANTHWPGRVAVFDCRVFNVPDIEELENCFLWRERDAKNNAVSMAAACFYSHKELLKKNESERLEMLLARGVNFDDYPARFRRGARFERVVQERVLTDAEMARIPEKYRPTGPVVRSGVVRV